MAQGRRHRRAGRIVGVALTVGALGTVVLGALGAAVAVIGTASVPAAAATGTYTWSGADAEAGTDLDWSDPGNWSTDTAPSGTVTAIDLPDLAACASASSSACVGDDDVSLTTGSLSVAGSYLVDGQTSSGSTSTLTVGGGGVSYTGPGQSALALPIDLSTAQTWTISQGLLALAAPVTGSSSLGVDLSGGADLTLGPGSVAGSDDEVGPLTVTGASSSNSGLGAAANGSVALAGVDGTPVTLDSTDGATTTVTDAALGGAGTIGPLVVHGGLLVVGDGTDPAGDLSVDGAVGLDAASAVVFGIVGSGATAGTDYGQLTASGGVSLGSAVLQVGMDTTSCTVPSSGTTYTLVSASGGVSGTFSAPGGGAVQSGGSVPLEPAPGCPATGDSLVLDYQAQQVTATVESGTGSTSPAPKGTTGTASTTALTASSTAVTVGATVGYQATVTPTPVGGTVTFSDDETPILACTGVPVSAAGTASCSQRYTAAGTHHVTATFSGTSAERGSTSPAVVVTVSAGGTTPTSPPGTEVVGAGYAITTATGWVYDFGVQRAVGSLLPLGVAVDDIVGVAATPDGRGYWLVSADGGVFAFGDAAYLGSLPAKGVSVDDVVGMAATPDGRGYWLVSADGGVFAFGDAPYAGSLPGSHVADTAVALVPASSGDGYWVIGVDGGVFAYGDAPYLGSVPAFGAHVRDVTSAST
jgi:hypothetical protein